MIKLQHIPYYGIIGISWLLVGFSWGDILAGKTRKGNQHFETGQYDEALQAYTEADVNSQGDDPRLPKLYNNMGNTLHQQENYEQAIAMYQKAFEASQDNRFKADVQYNMGNTWFKQGEYQQALEAYTQALELNPTHARAKQNKEIIEKLIVQPPQQQQQQQDQKNDQENKQEQQEQQQSQKEGEQQNPQKDEQQQQPQEPQTPQEDQESEQQKAQEDKEQQLSEEEALRILDALQEKEDLQQQRIQVAPRPVEKDW